MGNINGKNSNKGIKIKETNKDTQRTQRTQRTQGTQRGHTEVENGKSITTHPLNITPKALYLKDLDREGG